MSHSDDDRMKVATTLYDYVRRAIDAESTFYRDYLTKVHKLMTIQIVLFAGISYGMSKVDWMGGVVWWKCAPVLIFLAVAAVSTALAFYWSLRCLAITDVSVVGVSELTKAFEDDDVFGKLKPDKVYRDLGANLATMLRDERNRGRAREPWNRRINSLTLIGFISVALFVVGGMFGSMLTH
ncbi:MAG: hypothetical protein V3W34_00320 [Phycisphaerae bacterium]